MIGSEVTFAVRPPRKCQFGSSEIDDEPQEGSKKISQVMFEPPECFCCIRSKLRNDVCFSVVDADYGSMIPREPSGLNSHLYPSTENYIELRDRLDEDGKHIIPVPTVERKMDMIGNGPRVALLGLYCPK